MFLHFIFFKLRFICSSLLFNPHSSASCERREKVEREQEEGERERERNSLFQRGKQRTNPRREKACSDFILTTLLAFSFRDLDSSFQRYAFCLLKNRNAFGFCFRKLNLFSFPFTIRF